MNRRYDRHSKGDPIEFPLPPPPPPPQVQNDIYIPSRRERREGFIFNQHDSDPFPPPPPPVTNYSPQVNIRQQPQNSNQTSQFNHQNHPPISPLLQRNLSRASDRSSLSLNLEDLSRALTFLDNATLELELFSQLSPNSLYFHGDGEPLFTSEEIEKVSKKGRGQKYPKQTHFSFFNIASFLVIFHYF